MPEIQIFGAYIGVGRLEEIDIGGECQQANHQLLPNLLGVNVFDPGNIILLAKNVQVAAVAAHFIAGGYREHGLNRQGVL